MIVSRSSVAALSPAYYFIPQGYLIEGASRYTSLTMHRKKSFCIAV